jgi:hypothetical protein
MNLQTVVSLAVSSSAVLPGFKNLNGVFAALTLLLLLPLGGAAQVTGGQHVFQFLTLSPSARMMQRLPPQTPPRSMLRWTAN